MSAMDLERERRFQELVFGALAVEPEQQVAYLQHEAPDDQELVHEVLEHLKRDLGGFLEKSAVVLLGVEDQGD